MSWIENFVRPKIKALISKDDFPDDLWQNCPGCKTMLYQQDLVKHLNVCNHCGHHLRMNVDERLKMLFDGGNYQEVALPKGLVDPLKFKDRKKYTDRLKLARSKTGRYEAITVAKGSIEGVETVVAAMDLDFIMGSMSMAVGEGIVKAAEVAVASKSPLVAVTVSGGARMMEGVLSLMQMPRTTIAVEQVKEAGLPYVVILTDPTTGGVTASFAMLGDIHIAEPNAQICFAGKRVIQETIRETLPQGFQTSEFLKDHGMIDMVVPRTELKEKLGTILSILTVSNSRKAIRRSKNK